MLRANRGVNVTRENPTNRWRLAGWMAACVLLTAAACPAEPAGGEGGVEAITRPSVQATLSFAMSGQVAEVLVKEGDHVEKNAPLVRLDDRAEQVALERLKVVADSDARVKAAENQVAQLKAQATNDVRVRAAKAQLDQKKVDEEKVVQLQKEGGATEQEVQHARLDTLISQLSLELATFEREQDQLKAQAAEIAARQAKVEAQVARREYEEAKERLARMTLHSPLKGIVARLSVEAGEVVDAQQKLILVVRLDPLWIDVPVPRERAEGISLGDSAEARVVGGRAVLPGKVIFKSPLVDAASGTQTIRVEAANPDSRPAGEKVTVRFAARADAPAPAANPNP